MNCLLTGHSGFLGQKLILKLTEKYNLKTLSRSSGDYTISLEKFVPNFSTSFDLVVHAAGLAHFFPISDFDKDSFFDTNVNGTNNLLIGLKKSVVPKKFLFISSVAVYGASEGLNINESSNLNAKDPYGKSKIEAERIIERWCKENNVICTILRLPLVVDNNPPGNLGAMINAIKKGYYFNISGGTAKKSMVLADDVAKFILKAADVGGVYNLTDGYHPSFAELTDRISIKLSKSRPKNIPFWFANLLAKTADLVGFKSTFGTVKLKKITTSLTFDDTKARKSFGWNPTSVLNGINILIPF